MSNEIDMEAYATKLYNEVKLQFTSDTLTVANTMVLMRVAMEVADTYKEISGKQKKELVLRVLHQAFEDYVVDEIQNEAVKMLIDNLADIMIDNFVDIDLGNLNINHVTIKEKLLKFCPCCFKA